MVNSEWSHEELAIPSYGILATEALRAEPFTVDYHSHAHFQLLYVQSGALDFAIKDHDAIKVLRAGSVACVAQGVEHYVNARAPAVFSLVAISADFCNRYSLDMAWAHLAAWGSGVLDSIQTQEISRRFQRILLEQTDDRTARDGVIVAETLLLIAELARSIAVAHPRASDTTMNHLMSLVEERLYEAWDVDMAAERAHLSRRQFTARFKAHTGQSFVPYLTTLRLNFAKKLLYREGATIIGAAFSSGFSDLSHFYRVFKKECGMTPGAWVKNRG